MQPKSYDSLANRIFLRNYQYYTVVHKDGLVIIQEEKNENDY